MVTETIIENSLRYDSSLCVGCGLCTIVCPHRVFAQPERVAQLVAPNACIECGACQLNCPTGAITVNSGVGCAAAMIRAALTGGEVRCGDECCGGPSTPAATGANASCCAQDRDVETSDCCASTAQPAPVTSNCYGNRFAEEGWPVAQGSGCGGACCQGNQEEPSSSCCGENQSAEERDCDCDGGACCG